MKFYRTATTDDSQTPRWSASQSGAASDRKVLIAAGAKRTELDSDEVEIPTGKQGLLDWLNARGV